MLTVIHETAESRGNKFVIGRETFRGQVRFDIRRHVRNQFGEWEPRAGFWCYEEVVREFIAGLEAALQSSKEAK